MTHYQFEKKSEMTTAQLQLMAERFLSIKTPVDLAALLSTPPALLEKLAEKPKYQTFQIPKPGGRKRLIEHPEGQLKSVQQTLNRYLQALYFQWKTDCAYGFVLCPKDDPRPRNIYTNALRHCQSNWFLNIDLKDFFHQITTAQLTDLFERRFNFAPELSKMLRQLTTSNGRLPMGAPTSPALSNFVCLDLDAELAGLSKKFNAVFTRFADDLTFSFQRELPIDFEYFVRVALLQNRFEVNEEKVKTQTRLEQPEITGLVVGTGASPTVSEQWLKKLKQEIKIYEWLRSEAVRERGLFHVWTFERFRQSVGGQLEFLGFVLGKDHRDFRKMSGRVQWV